MTKEVTVQIVTFNNKDYISNCLASLFCQSENHRILLIDNASNDGTFTEGIPTNNRDFTDVIIQYNSSNLGFAAAHNQGFRLSASKYILVLNPDVILTPNFIEELVNILKCDPRAGAACGKLLRLGYDGQTTNIIDSTGLIIRKNRRGFDRGMGEADLGQYDKQDYVFGASGAAVLYRREMLEDIKISVGVTNPLGPGIPTNVTEEYFDESFFAYKEDIDLAWRAQLRGWKCAYVPKAVAYHARGWQPNKRKKIPRFIQIHSFKNRYLMLLKNEEWQNFIINLPRILLFETVSFLYIIFKAPFLIKGWLDLLKLLRQTIEKRKQIMVGKKVEAGELRKWFR